MRETVRGTQPEFLCLVQVSACGLQLKMDDLEK